MNNINNLGEILLKVQRPARYIGGEWNSVKKDWSDDKVKVLLAFPDVYEIGSSYLGSKILYGILNAEEDILCERVFSPWKDFEDALRENRISLFSLESRRPINQFDIIGFSLTHELGYTNVLNILELGGIPKISGERSDNDPLIIAGGPSCYNPEPMAEFIDAFLIGDGEEAILEIVDAFKKSKVKSQKSKAKILNALADIKGVYVPSLYKMGVSPKIEKRVVKDLDEAFYPTEQIVPHIEVVHDRLILEIMRGCKHACKFCQATASYRPCRERSRERIMQLAKESYAMTGYDEISLLSLSSGDHSQIKEIIEDLNREFSQRHVSVSVPSLRIEDVLRDLPRLISKVKKSGLTFAPEAGSERLRKLINKNIDIERLFESVTESFRAGWRRVKLYFMIGLPTEEEGDIRSIAELIYKVSDMKKNLDGRGANVAASINAFLPKPHTPFEREAMDSMGSLERKKSLLKSLVRSRMIELDFHPFEMSRIEAVLSRGDRRVSALIYEAHRMGARFDGWQDIFDYDIWVKAFEKASIDPAFYSDRRRNQDEILPWGFIDSACVI